MIVAQLACLVGTLANMYDVVMPNYHSSCTNGCLAWSEAAQSLPASANLTQPLINNMFIENEAGAIEAATNCAMPGARAGTHEQDCGLGCKDERDQYRYVYDSYAGPWCFCKDTGPCICVSLTPLPRPPARPHDSQSTFGGRSHIPSLSAARLCVVRQHMTHYDSSL